MDKVIKLSDLIAYTNDQIEESKEERDATSISSEKSYNSGEIMALRRLRRWATGTAVPLDQVTGGSEMSGINCADCPFRKRENSFNTHKFRDECHHPKAAFTRGVAYPEIGRGRAITPDHSDPPVIKTHPNWCPRALARKEGAK